MVFVLFCALVLVYGAPYVVLCLWRPVVLACWHWVLIAAGRGAHKQELCTPYVWCRYYQGELTSLEEEDGEEQGRGKQAGKKKKKAGAKAEPGGETVVEVGPLGLAPPCRGPPGCIPTERCLESSVEETARPSLVSKGTTAEWAAAEWTTAGNPVTCFCRISEQ